MKTTQKVSVYHIDDTDKKILKFLVKNARMPYLEIARECGVSGAAIHQRVKKMENNGVITGSRLLVKPSTLGLNVCAYIAVSLSNGDLDSTIEALKKIPEVVECHFITGEFGMLLKIYCSDHNHLMDVICNKLTSIPSIRKTETWLSLNQAIDRQIWVDNYTEIAKKKKK